jgi:rapamycin-insensitive companion of mTOR
LHLRQPNGPNRSLARDSKHAAEKEQVVKLIRAIVEIGSQRAPNTAVGTGKVPLSETVIRAFIAVAEHSEDPFRNICVQTLVEIRMSLLEYFMHCGLICGLSAVLIDTELMARTGGMRVILHAMAEGPLDMAPLIASAFLYIVDSPRTREYLSPGTELEVSIIVTFLASK